MYKLSFLSVYQFKSKIKVNSLSIKNNENKDTLQFDTFFKLVNLILYLFGAQKFQDMQRCTKGIVWWLIRKWELNFTWGLNFINTLFKVVTCLK